LKNCFQCPFENDVQYLYDNARSHTARIVTERIERLGWFIVPQLPILEVWSIFSEEKSLTTKKKFVVALDEYFASKNVDFYLRVFEKLQEIWEKIIDYNGEYFVE
jgi:hypothetical protein